MSINIGETQDYTTEKDAEDRSLQSFLELQGGVPLNFLSKFLICSSCFFFFLDSKKPHPPYMSSSSAISIKTHVIMFGMTDEAQDEQHKSVKL